MYRECKTFAEASACVSDLCDACAALAGKLGYSTHDARVAALDNIIGTARAFQMILNLLDKLQRGDDETRQRIPQYLGLKVDRPESVDEAVKVLENSAKLGLLVLSQFQIENLLRNLARELKLPPVQKFYVLAKSVLDAVTIPKDRLDVLNTPARIRNSLHSNGIHKGYPGELPKVIVRGVIYEFIDGQVVTCASWGHICNALEASVGVLEEVFSTPPIRAIPTPLMDQFAWEVETKPE